MDRRAFLRRTSFAGIALFAGGVAWRRARIVPPSLAALSDELTVLRARTLIGTGAWSPYTVFAHLAQSVRYSMEGYPAMKPAWFRASAGAAAFFAFETAGAMHHGLDEPLPGAPALAQQGDVVTAIDALVAALEGFDAHEGALQPHFAYGLLDKPRYAMAHAMHLHDHLSEIRVDS